MTLPHKTEYPERRLQLHELLCEVLGSRNVYFQPPESIKMQYPAIVYNLDDIQNFYADNGNYLSERRYQLTLIDEDPDTDLIGKILEIPNCQYNRHYNSDNLNQDVFTLFF